MRCLSRPGLLAMVVTAWAAPVLAEEVGFRVLDVNLERGLVLVEERLPPEREGEDSPRCRNRFNGGRGLALVVHPLAGGTPQRVELAGFPKKGPCPTAESVERARAAAPTTLTPLGLSLDGPPLSMRPFAAAGTLAVEEQRIGKDEDMDVQLRRTLRLDRASLLATSHTFGQWMAGTLLVHSWLVEKAGQGIVVHRLAYTSMRSDSTTIAVDGPLRLPANGVDVGAVASVASTLPAGCEVSIVASTDLLQRTVAVTLRDALRARKVPSVGRARAARTTSAVYTVPACDAAAKSLAPLVPGGAAVEPLTWDAKGGIVVALGDSALSTKAP